MRARLRRWSGLAMAGVGGLGLGLGLVTVDMAMLGQEGMPRMYFTYVPQFETLHQLVGVGGMIAALGLGVVGLAIARGPRAHEASPERASPRDQVL